jgi:pimeloyl-ACP methyl ester carboxylesterase
MALHRFRPSRHGSFCTSGADHGGIDGRHIVAVADALGAPSTTVLAAESAGAGVALEVVRQAPGRFAGAVLVGAAWQRPSQGSQEALVAGLRQDFLATIARFVDACLPETQSQDLRRWGIQLLSRSTPEAAIELLRCREMLALEQHLEKIAIPTLLLHGDQDAISPPSASKILATRMPQADLRLLPGLGHVPIITEPAAMARLIDDHFSGLGAV